MAKILLVDDDFDFVSGVTVVLESAGYKVVSTHSREDGMALFEKEKPDLAILDVMMDQPDDGFTLANDLKRKHPEAKIMMLSSIGQVTGMNYDKDDEMVPVDAFEEKPIMPNKLLEKVKELLTK
ncbi:MAG: response regulator [Candidatus Marinimicrobia bacterium]|nr:response regulator [Candidatus Neomarinimicrobiota bacterium]